MMSSGGRGVSHGDGTKDASLEALLGVGERLARHELRAAVGELDHHGGVVLLGGLENLKEGTPLSERSLASFVT